MGEVRVDVDASACSPAIWFILSGPFADIGLLEAAAVVVY
jgi:hypothetical protein